jgi:ribulose-phosphate 3-epimerase
LIIPAINCRHFEEAVRRLRQAKKFLPAGGWLHLDVVDGRFAPNITWGNPSEFRFLAAEAVDLNFEVHLMVERPEETVQAWWQAGVKRVIVHLEAMSDSALLLAAAEEAGGAIMLAISPETPVETLLPYLASFSFFQVLAVAPGLAGQKFEPQILAKVKFLRQRAPNAKIEVDGGINPETAQQAKAAGADILVSASYIFNHPDPSLAYQNLTAV